MQHYHVIARRYRPKRFADVLGQDSVVTALKNSIQNGRIGHAYLFSGSKGTGKTTLARLFAKALNCSAREGAEPCNKCPACLEIQQGTPLGLIEMDGASHRGIDDIRKIQESAPYRPLHGRYTLYLIDEVHMLTKEAFNALLKILEEPPAHVVFLFATTEAHKLPATIVSRCQRFSLRRIPETLLIQKLKAIAADLNRSAETGALARIARLADGAFRDAESLLDQLLAFHDGVLTESAVEAMLGLPAHSFYIQLDDAGARGQLQIAFNIVEQLFTQGVDLMHFFEGLLLHIRTLLTIRLNGAIDLSCYSKDDIRAAQLYEEGQLVHLFDYLVEAHDRLRRALSPRMTLESILLYLLRSHRTVSFPQLMDRLTLLEKSATNTLELPMAAPASLPAPYTPIATSLPPPITLPQTEQTPSVTTQDTSHSLQSHYETLLQFASVELPGRIEKTTHFNSH